MPGAFDFFGRFETSLRTYNKDARPLPLCPHGVHSPEECECDPHHECKRPHCSNDIPLDPLCKLSQGTPFGVPISMWSYHKCHSGGCDSQENIKSVSVIRNEVTERLYSTPTRSSTAKLRSGSSRYISISTIANDDLGETSDDSSGAALTERSLDTTDSPSSSVDCKDGPRLVSQLITAHPPGNHNQSRKDGISPSSSRRSLSARGRRTTFSQRVSTGNTCKRSQSSCAAPSTKNKVQMIRNGPRVNESDVTTTSSEPPSSPDVSPDNTPSLTPRKMLSPRHSGNQLIMLQCPSKPVGSTPRPCVFRPSAVFAGGRYKIKPAPLNKSASDGVERLRSSFRRSKCNGTAVAVTKKEPTKSGYNSRNKDISSPIPFSMRTRLSRVASDSRVDELLTHAHMVLETLTPEQDSSIRSHHSPLNTSCTSQDLQPTAARKLSGSSYKDLASMIHRKMEEMNQALVSNGVHLHLLMDII